jgi:hypothetical protein
MHNFISKKSSKLFEIALKKYTSSLRIIKSWRRYLKVSPLNCSSGKLPYRYALVRILGSDHAPRHDSNQTINNLEFTLENEPNFPGVRKIFIINRIFNKDKEAKIIELLSRYDCDYVQIPFESDKYKTMGWDMNPLGGEELSKNKPARPIKITSVLLAAAPKIRYAMNINGARNTGLKEAFRVAEWALVLDGNCFLTAESFKILDRSTSSYPHVPYIILPMARLSNNNDVFNNLNRECIANDEPQIAIHCSASTHYNEDLPYGYIDKVELLVKLGVNGSWNNWMSYRSRKIISESSRGILFKESSAVVFRLSSGVNDMDTSKDRYKRYVSRFYAILNSLAYLDDLYKCKNVDAEKMIFGEIIQYKDKSASIDDFKLKKIAVRF